MGNKESIQSDYLRDQCKAIKNLLDKISARYDEELKSQKNAKPNFQENMHQIFHRLGLVFYLIHPSSYSEELSSVCEATQNFLRDISPPSKSEKEREIFRQS